MEMGNLVEGQTDSMTSPEKRIDPVLSADVDTTIKSPTSTQSVDATDLTLTIEETVSTPAVKTTISTDVSSVPTAVQTKGSVISTDDLVDIMELYDFGSDSETEIIKEKSKPKKESSDDEEVPKTVKSSRTTTKRPTKKGGIVEKASKTSIKKAESKETSSVKKEEEKVEKVEKTKVLNEIEKKLTLRKLLKDRYAIDMSLKKMTETDALIPLTVTLNGTPYTFKLGTKSMKNILLKIRDNGLIDEHVFPDLDTYLKEINEKITTKKIDFEKFEKEFEKNKSLFEKFTEWKKQSERNSGDASYYSCLICNNFYNGGEHTPYGLQCGHIICEYCKKKTTKCPMCNTRISALKTPIKLFPLVSPNIMFLDDVKKSVKAQEQLRDEITAQIASKKVELDSIANLVEIAKCDIKDVKTDEIIDYYMNKTYVIKTPTVGVHLVKLRDIASFALTKSSTTITCAYRTKRQMSFRFNIPTAEKNLPEILLVLYNDTDLKKIFVSYDPTSRKKSGKYIPCITDLVDDCKLAVATASGLVYSEGEDSD
jgi:hypothetical protein